MPSKSAFLDWVDDDRDGLADRYTRAREKLMDHWADEIIEIADDQTLEPNDRRVKCDNRRWLMSKLAPRKYGDKLVHTGDPDTPIQVLHKAVHIAPLTDAELEALDRFMTERLKLIDRSTT